MTVEITDDNYGTFLSHNDKLYLLDFWMPGCKPCEIIGPFLDELSIEYKDEVAIGKVDVSSNLDLTSKFGVRNVPTILFIKNGEVLEKFIGKESKKGLEDKIKLNLLR
jgi:thioredoxin 1